ncbi:hypothetical protein F383_39235 [Gossypium arboreum]|uniref:Uncharacterized protein n=1 Tax=Gossypium arboreum TaxID=29729 RepID=A0A0B0MPF7_GOSAR|nr:hypothetical protein F383_39235 [Gossypium arboreum]
MQIEMFECYKLKCLNVVN